MHFNNCDHQNKFSKIFLWTVLWNCEDNGCNIVPQPSIIFSIHFTVKKTQDTEKAFLKKYFWKTFICVQEAKRHYIKRNKSLVLIRFFIQALLVSCLLEFHYVHLLIYKFLIFCAPANGNFINNFCRWYLDSYFFP